MLLRVCTSLAESDGGIIDTNAQIAGSGINTRKAGVDVVYYPKKKAA